LLELTSILPKEQLGIFKVVFEPDTDKIFNRMRNADL